MDFDVDGLSDGELAELSKAVAERLQRRKVLAAGAGAAVGGSFLAGQQTARADPQSTQSGTYGDGDEDWNVQDIDANHVASNSVTTENNDGTLVVRNESELSSAISDVEAGNADEILVPSGAVCETTGTTLPDASDWSLVVNGRLKLADGADTDLLSFPANTSVTFIHIGGTGVIDGNKANNTAGHGLFVPQDTTALGMDFSATIEDAAEDGIHAAMDKNSGGKVVECRFGGRVSDAAGVGLFFDTQVFTCWVSTVIRNCGSHGIETASTLTGAGPDQLYLFSAGVKNNGGWGIKEVGNAFKILSAYTVGNDLGNFDVYGNTGLVGAHAESSDGGPGFRINGNPTTMFACQANGNAGDGVVTGGSNGAVQIYGGLYQTNGGVDISADEGSIVTYGPTVGTSEAVNGGRLDENSTDLHQGGSVATPEVRHATNQNNGPVYDHVKTTVTADGTNQNIINIGDSRSGLLAVCGGKSNTDQFCDLVSYTGYTGITTFGSNSRGAPGARSYADNGGGNIAVSFSDSSASYTVVVTRLGAAVGK